MYLFIEANADKQAKLLLIQPATGDKQAEKEWSIERNLSQTLLANLLSFLEDNQLQLGDLEAIAVFAGPAAFTDLRITHSIANALAYSLEVPVVNTSGEDWITACYDKLKAGGNDQIVKPNYGRPPNITKQRK